MNESAQDQLDRLLGFIGSDPNNVNLLIDAIEAALRVPSVDQAKRLVDRLSAVRPGSFEAGYFAGTLAMIQRDFASAVAFLSPLVANGAPANARFNLAWSKAMLGQKEDAFALLDAEVTSSIAAAAMLRMQLQHEAGNFDDAMEFGKAALLHHPDDPGLNAALATLALDLEDLDLARDCAARGGSHPEALAAAGMLDMQDGDIATAQARFDQSLAAREHNPRAWIGLGLAKLASHDSASAAVDLDRGAQQFGDHIGSWIAAGYAHYLSGDIDGAAQRFERACAIDPNFAESQGSLAVIDAARGDRESAQRRMTTAFRLDRECFSAALAKIMLQADNPDLAQQLIEKAFTTPLNESGMTVSSFLAGMSRPTVH